MNGPEDLLSAARLIIRGLWSHGPDRLARSATEVSEWLEDFAKTASEPAFQHFLTASPRQQFRTVLRAMRLPDFEKRIDSELSGLGLLELEIVWLSMHLNEVDPDERDRAMEEGCRFFQAWRTYETRHVRMILMHIFSRSLGSAKSDCLPRSRGERHAT